jgi:hypothetical protein
MGSAIGQIFNPIASLVTSVASVAFPPLGIAMSAANLLQGAIGGAVGQAVGQLTQQCGMPGFLGSMVKDIIQDVIGKLTKPSDPQCDHACHQHFGHEIQDFAKDFSKSVFDGAKAIMDQGNNDETSGAKGGKGGGASSWLVAIAKAMGSAAGKHADKLVELSNKIDQSSQSKDKGAAGDNTALTMEFQAESQMLSMLQNAFSTAIKSIGEGLTTAARKG